MKVLAIATHPIQYQAPWFRVLAAQPELEFSVAYASLPGEEMQGVGFGVRFAWDLPLLEGYRWSKLDLASRRPSLDRFFGLRSRNLSEVLRTRKPDVVLLTGWNSLVLVQALVAARRLAIPCVVRGDSNDLGPKRLGRRLAHRLLFRSYAACLPVGRANRRFYRARGVPTERLFDAPHCVDNRRFEEQQLELAGRLTALRAGFGVPPGALGVLFAGKLTPKKRPLDLVAAAALARARGASVHLLVAGEGELRTAVAQAAAGRVPISFCGFLNQTEIARAYVAADLLVLPSDAGETWGLVVNEAMACSRPAVVSDLAGCCEDLIEDGVTGWSYRCGDVDGLARHLEEGAANRDQLAAMGGRAQERVHESYSLTRAVEGTVRAVEHALRDRQG